MRELLLAGLLLLALAGSSVASDLKAPPPAAAYDWTGFYMGGHLGYAAGWSNWSASQAGSTASSLSGTLNFIDAYNFSTGAGSYLLGFQAGYNYMAASRWLVGVETDGSFPNSVGGNRTFSSALSGEANYLEDVEFSGTVRGRIGYAPGNWLFYVTGGFAWSYDQVTRTQIVGVPTGGTALPGAIENL